MRAALAVGRDGTINNRAHEQGDIMTSRIHIRHALELIYLLIRKDLKVRYKSSVLGYLWTLANPFAFGFVYWVAFKLIMRVEMENYSLFLLSAMFPWLWLSAGVTQATSVYRNNASLVKKVNLHRAILPLSVILQEMVNFIFAIPVLIAFFYFTAKIIHPSWLWQVPLMLTVQLIFAFPVALTLAIWNVFVHDIEYLIGIAFSLLFFATPIVYPTTMIPAEYRGYFEASPLHALVQSWRSIFFSGTLDFASIGYCLVVGAVCSVIAAFVFARLAHKIGEFL